MNARVMNGLLFIGALVAIQVVSMYLSLFVFKGNPALLVAIIALILQVVVMIFAIRTARTK